MVVLLQLKNLLRILMWRLLKTWYYLTWRIYWYKSYIWFGSFMNKSGWISSFPGSSWLVLTSQKTNKDSRCLFGLKFISFLIGFFVLLFIWVERQKEKASLSFSSFYPFDFGYDQCPTSWIGVRKLPEKRQGAPWIELDELHFAREIFLVRKILYWKFKIKKIKAPSNGRKGAPILLNSGGGRLASLLPTGREVHLTHLPTHQSRCSADLHW